MKTKMPEVINFLAERIKKISKRIKHYYKVRKIENDIVNTHVQKMFYGDIDTYTWWTEIQRLEKELAEAKSQKDL